MQEQRVSEATGRALQMLMAKHSHWRVMQPAEARAVNRSPPATNV